MSIAEHIKPWSGYAFRHITDIGTSDVRDFRYCAFSKTNRWNSKGEPTLYLAKDKYVAIGEFSRHFSENRPQKQATRIQSRQIWKLSVDLNKTIDLCNLEASKALALTNPRIVFQICKLPDPQLHF